MRNRCLLLLLIFGCLLRTQAAFRPSFMLDHSAWNATDIVLVRATPVNGEFRVVEVLKGNLHPGEHISIPALQPTPDAIPIAQYPADWEPAEASVSTRIPRQLAGARLVLFLKQTSSSPLRSEWSASNQFGDMKASVVWIEGARLFRFVQTTNPGPSSLQPWNLPLPKLRARVSTVVRAQRELADIVRIQDSAQRAIALRPYLLSKLLPARMFAEEELGKCGPAAVPAIDAMLDDETFASESSVLVQALVRAGGPNVGRDLTARLGRDLDFWKRTGPRLHQGWWNDDPTPTSPLRNRYLQTLELVRALDNIRFPGALPTASALRAFWHSLPQLDDPSGLNQLSEECGKLVVDLQRP